jgi:UDP-glucuronate 4-epimerase
MKLLITGTAGFIGYHLTKKLSSQDHDIICIDNINDYYDVDLKMGRLKALGFAPETISSNVSIPSSSSPSLRFIKTDICDQNQIKKIFSEEKIDIAFHLAAQAGVRYSLINPDVYINSNIQGFLNILEAAKSGSIKHLVYASSSSVYGLNAKVPFSENDPVNQPASLYAATKRSNELMAFTYSQLYGVPSTGLRFFTVYGPWGRPDMAPYIFTKSIMEGKPINVFNNGNMKRDFTYVDDIIEGIIRIARHIPERNAGSDIPAAIYNIGNGGPVQLMDFVRILENEIGKKAIINYTPMQKGDVAATWADCSALEQATGFKPRTDLSPGIHNFVEWYRGYYG